MQLFLPRYHRLKNKPTEDTPQVRQLLSQINEERSRIAALEGEIQSLNAQIKLKQGRTRPALQPHHARVSSQPPPTVNLQEPSETKAGPLFPSMYKKDFFPRKLLEEQKVFGRPKDKTWEYREQLLRNKHIIRASHG